MLNLLRGNLVAIRFGWIPFHSLSERNDSEINIQKKVMSERPNLNT